jgi:tetratricopeptide (TPR) repeat protein
MGNSGRAAERVERGARHRRRAIAIGVVAGAVLGCLGPVRAQDAVASDSITQQELLFQQTLREPTNLEATFAFVRVATANRDYEAAIGALERVLFYQPGLARVNYELGALYFRLRSYEMARRYFREALASPDLDPVTRDRIETSLPDAEKQLQPSRLSGYLQGGVRYQSNATYAPNGGVVSLNGLDLALLPSATKKSDVNAFGLAGINHDYELDNGRGDTLETRFVGYGTDQSRFHDLDVGLAELTFGPRFALAPELLPGASIKPYVVGGNIWLGGAQYLSIGGAGISANFPVQQRVTLTPGFEWNHVDVDTGSTLPVSTFNTGNWYTASLAVTVPITEQLTLRAQGLYRRATAAMSFFDFDQWEADAAVTYAFASPFGASLNWSVTPFGRVIRTAFDAPNPAIDPLMTRRDTEWTAGMIFDTPISKTFGVSTTVQYDRTGSTLPNYRQDNLSAMTGPTVRF